MNTKVEITKINTEMNEWKYWILLIKSKTEYFNKKWKYKNFQCANHKSITCRIDIICRMNVRLRIYYVYMYVLIRVRYTQSETMTNDDKEREI